MKNEEKEGEKRKEKEEKSIHLGWSSVEFSRKRGNAFFRVLSKVPATSGATAEH